jgi:hypothetical protein
VKRLAITGATLASGHLSTKDLQDALVGLGAAGMFDDVAVRDLYFQLAKISGGWLNNEQSKEASSVAVALRRAGNDLTRIADLLTGNYTGFRTTTQFYSTHLATQALAKDPTLKIDSRQFLAQFQKDAVQVAKACLSVSVDLSEKSAIKGRETLVWYDDFTRLLVSVAARAKIKPTLGNDPVTGRPLGWLFDAAVLFEQFLYEQMRSESVYACGKRLERSLKRLKIR